MPAPEDAGTETAPPLRLAAAMLLISFATVLFTLSVWKLLSFFIMPSLFFDLLFVGFPLGAFLGVRVFRITLGSFLKTLWILQASMLASIGLSLLCQKFDYLRAHLFEVELGKLIGQMATFTGFFLPFFAAYGLSEYVGYQLGSRSLRGRMPIVYAIYLFGAAFAYLFYQLSLRSAGITGLLGLAVLLVALASLILSRSRAAIVVALVECGALLAAAGFAPGLPAIESAFLGLYKGKGAQSTHDFAANHDYSLAFQRWGKYSLTEIMRSPDARQFAGFYNDLMQWEYGTSAGFEERMLGATPINIAPRGGRIAIVGAGGGRQVKWALQPRFSFASILALEVEPAVIEAVEGPLRDEFGRVYDKGSSSPVQVVVAEARGYMEASRDAYDVIFMPSVGGYPQMMLEPGNMIRTVDAYRTLKDHLTPGGILAIWYPSGLDPKNVLTEQYVRTLGGQGLGMKTRAYANYQEFLILAAKDPSTRLPEPAEIDAFLEAPADPSGLPPRTDPASKTRNFLVLHDDGFRPITDEQPFLAGNVRHIFSLEQLYELFAIAGGFLAFAGALLAAGLRRGGDPRIPGRPYWMVAGISFLIGANFVVFEHYVILALFKKLYMFQDAVTIGAISFLVVSGLGSVLIRPRTRALFQAIAAVIVCAVPFLQDRVPSEALLALVAPVAFATGSFFPAVFEYAARNPLAVFAMDAVGAAVGSSIAFFVPIAFGFSAFFPVGAALFLVTSLLTWLFCRGLERPLPQT